MRKISVLLIIFLIFAKNIFADSVTDCEPCGKSKDDGKGSKTFFRPRSVIEDQVLFLALNNYEYFQKYYGPDCMGEETPYIFLSRGIFVEKSTRKNRLARYFMINNQDSATIKEDGTGDIGSLNLKVIAPDDELFSSVLTMCPERLIVGGYTNYHQNFCICGRDAWVDIKFALYWAQHRLNPKEVLTNPEVMGSLPDATTALEFLGSTQVHFGKISKCKESLTNFDDIEVKLGFNIYGEENSGRKLDFYGSILLPIAPKPTAEFLFEPLVGRGHFGLGAGLNGAVRFIDCPNKVGVLMFDFTYQYLFRGTELRTLDLNTGDWTRFLRVVESTNTLRSFTAANFTTLPLQVTPGGMINFWTAAHFQHNCMHFEVGYNLYWRQSERVCLKEECFDPSLHVGVFDMVGVANSCNGTVPTTADSSNISQSLTLPGLPPVNEPTRDPVFTPLTVFDLNLASASHPSLLTNKFYGAVAYDFEWWCRPINLGIGGAYEFSRNKNALSQWEVWGNLVVSF